MTLRGKLIAMQTPFFLALAMLSLVSVAALTGLGAKSQEILKDNYRSVLAAQRMDEALERLDDAASRMLLGGKAEEAKRMAKPHIERFAAELAVEESNITEPGEREIAGRLRSHWVELLKLFDQFLRFADREAAVSFYNEHLQPAFAKVRVDSVEILGINQDAMVRKSDRAISFSRQLQWMLLAGWLAATVSALFIAWKMTGKFVQPIYSLQRAVKRIGEGDLEVRAQLGGKDEVAMLAKDFNAMAERLQQYRKSSLGELLRAQQAAQASIDSLPEPIIVFGPQREILSVNMRAQELLGDFASLDDLGTEPGAVLRQVLNHVFDGKGPYFSKGIEETIRVTGPRGDHYLLPTAYPLRDEEGTATGVTVALQDVTRFKRFDELKDDMVSTVAHEFRTPLTSIRMAIHICLEELAGPLTPKQADMLSAAREECERLQTLVDDLLDLSRLQRGITPTSPEPVSASLLIHQAAARRRDDAEAAGVVLKDRLEGVDLQVLADQARVATVFDNLIGNALRYSPDNSEVWIKARPGDGTVRFEVIDNGPGIPRQHLDRIFDRMYQVPGVEGGSRGLGLSIVREIVLAHGGEVGVESAPGSGSTFWFTLRQAKEEESA
jgi:signal transduction histidine kinase